MFHLAGLGLLALFSLFGFFGEDWRRAPDFTDSYEFGGRLAD